MAQKVFYLRKKFFKFELEVASFLIIFVLLQCLIYVSVCSVVRASLTKLQLKAIRLRNFLPFQSLTANIILFNDALLYSLEQNLAKEVYLAWFTVHTVSSLTSLCHNSPHVSSV